jgi:hypothetical protein
MLGFSHIAWDLSQVTRGSGKEIFVWGQSQQKYFGDLKNTCAQPHFSHYPTCNIRLRLRQMFQTMLWAQFSLIMDILWPIIVRHYQIRSISTTLTKKKCTPLYNNAASGGITFSIRRQSSTLIIILCSSCKHKENC